MKKSFLFLFLSVFLFGCNEDKTQTGLFVLTATAEGYILGAMSICGWFMLSDLDNAILPTEEQINEQRALNSVRVEEYGRTEFSYQLVARISFLPKPDDNFLYLKHAIHPTLKSDWKIVFGRAECRLLNEQTGHHICQFIISERIATQNFTLHP